jgi:glycosyltransferase involved in cell wall biosynthesis
MFLSFIVHHFMLPVIKVARNQSTRFDYTILVPTWNNLELLKNCLRSIETHSSLQPQIIIIINEGKDGTATYVEQSTQYDYIHAQENIGICYGLNAARSLVQSDYVLYINDDMYALPLWDEYLFKEIHQFDHKNWMLSGTMIEPTDTGNNCVIVQDFGNSLANFKEKELLLHYQDIEKSDWSGSTWPPSIMHIDTWDIVGGMSVEFHPGMYSDPDLSKKLYDIGVRYFKGVGRSRVYHFGSKSTKRVKRNKGRHTFLQKWGITANTFMHQILRIGQPFFALPQEKITLPLFTRWINGLKRKW